MERSYKIFVINPGSTSTRVAYYENDHEKCGTKLEHSPDDIAKCKTINDQLPMRKKMVMDYIEKSNIREIDAIISRGGGGRPVHCGGYAITPLMVEECSHAPWPHASNLGVMISIDLMKKFNVPGYIYDAPLADDFTDLAKVSGLPEFPIQRGAGHPLNEKAAGYEIARKLGGRYEDCNFIICHLGGGITVNAHSKGKIIDSHINAFSPSRSGALPMIAFTKKCFSGSWDFNTAFNKQMSQGGLFAYIGTGDIVEVDKRIDAGDEKADFYFSAMIYQIAKDIGGMATVISGDIDRIILTGEIAHSKRLVERLAKRVSFIAPVEVVPGAYEMEALVAGALRMLRGEEKIKDYDTEDNL